MTPRIAAHQASLSTTNFQSLPNLFSDTKINICIKTVIHLLGSYNRKLESKMAVAKRQGREKPTKIEQRKVKERSEDQSEDFR